jgi:hypothetical protein
MPDPLYDNPRSPTGDKYETKLSDKDEGGYQKWVKGKKNAAGGNISDDTDYDTRGWWKETGGEVGENGHGTDKFKKPSHPTFSNESKYHGVDGNEGGEWKKGDDNKWTFKPGKTNRKNGLDKTREYLQESDPDVTLEE